MVNPAKEPLVLSRFEGQQPCSDSIESGSESGITGSDLIVVENEDENEGEGEGEGSSTEDGGGDAVEGEEGEGMIPSIFPVAVPLGKRARGPSTAGIFDEIQLVDDGIDDNKRFEDAVQTVQVSPCDRCKVPWATFGNDEPTPFIVPPATPPLGELATAPSSSSLASSMPKTPPMGPGQMTMEPDSVMTPSNASEISVVPSFPGPSNMFPCGQCAR